MFPNIILCLLLLLSSATSFSTPGWRRASATYRKSTPSDDDGDSPDISAASISSERSRLEASFCGGDDPDSKMCDTEVDEDAAIASELLQLLRKQKANDTPDQDSRNLYGDLKSKLLSSPKAMGEFLARSRGEDLYVAGAEGALGGDGETLLPTEPNSALTPSDVVQTVLDSLRAAKTTGKGDETANPGVTTLFSFTSPASSLKGTSVAEFILYLPQSKYVILLDWEERVWGKMEMSADKEKAYVNCRLRRNGESSWKSVSFTLSSRNELWLIDSMLVREKNGE